MVAIPVPQRNFQPPKSQRSARVPNTTVRIMMVVVGVDP